MIPTFRPYYRDIVDHVNRVLEQIDTLREMLSFAFEASLLLELSRQSKTGRQLAGWAAILAVPTAIAGIYGMNFANMPELEWRYGYFGVLAMIGRGLRLSVRSLPPRRLDLARTHISIRQRTTRQVAGIA